MKLIYSPPSPFARKVLVLAHEAGLTESIELVSVAVLPTTRNETAHAFNPLGKVPTLILANGDSVFDSRTILEYLNSVSRTRDFIPEADARWAVLTKAALADGILDAALSIRYETALRPEERRWPDWIAGQRLKITQALVALESSISYDESTFDISHISLACALAYLNFRLPELNWAEIHPQLRSFYSTFGARPSMAQTQPG